jgi:hypothetical protein
MTLWVDLKFVVVVDGVVSTSQDLKFVVVGGIGVVSRA